MIRHHLAPREAGPRPAKLTRVRMLAHANARDALAYTFRQAKAGTLEGKLYAR